MLSKETGEPLNPLQELIGEYYAIATENAILQDCGDRIFLPPAVLAVLEGEDPTPEYWEWLIDQYKQMQSELEDRQEQELQELKKNKGI